MFKYIKIIIIALLLSSCQQDQADNKAKIHTVKLIKHQNSKHYQGVINPACYSIVASSSAGYISHIIIPYGALIQPKQKIMTIEDPKINTNYISTVVTFLENKEKRRKAKVKLAGEQELFKAGVVARNELEDDEYNYNAAQVTFMRSLIELQEQSNIIGLDYKPIAKLTLKNMAEISKTISQHFSIQVSSLKPGRWMSPLLLNSINKSDLKPAYLGQKVEKGQVLGFVLDDSCGLMVKFFVDQQQLADLKLNMPVKIKSLALKSILTGQISHIGHFDVISEESSGKLLFPVTATISLPTKTVKAMSILGLSVDVIVDFGDKMQLRVPSNAIQVKNDMLLVEKIDSLGKKTLVPVKLGKSGVNDIEVIAGIKAGDQVLLYD